MSVSNIVYAWDHADLEAALAAGEAFSEWTLVLGNEDYTWPDGVELPLGLSMIGSGWNLDGGAGGTRISSIGRVVGLFMNSTD